MASSSFSPRATRRSIGRTRSGAPLSTVGGAAVASLLGNNLMVRRRVGNTSTRGRGRLKVKLSPQGLAQLHHGNQESLVGQKPNAGWKKRRRDDDVENEEELKEPCSPLKKKPRFIVELEREGWSPSTTTLLTKLREGSKDVDISNGLEVNSPEVQSPAPSAPQTAGEKIKKSTIHQGRVAHGIKHELDRLQPITGDKRLKDQRRKLRSQEGTRFKSDLALYFPEYDEIIGNDEKENHVLNIDTRILLVDEANTSKHPFTNTDNSISDYPVKVFPETLFYDLHDAQRIDSTALDDEHMDHEAEDRLSAEYFEAIHRRPERAERAVRNGDKGRAQHEKDKVIRLLEGLQGPDWLKVMGVSGIRESKKKEFDAARIHFIKGCQGILEKFRSWREEEKRRKIEKDTAISEAAAEREAEAREEEDEDDYVDGEPRDLFDMDAAARQLKEEATAHNLPIFKIKSSLRKSKYHKIHPVLQEPLKEFRSFFQNPHEREAALKQHRHSGRKVVAWGHPVPNIPRRDFDLPEEYRDKATLRQRARQKRAERRVNRH